MSCACEPASRSSAATRSHLSASNQTPRAPKRYTKSSVQSFDICLSYSALLSIVVISRTALSFPRRRELGFGSFKSVAKHLFKLFSSVDAL